MIVKKKEIIGSGIRNKNEMKDTMQFIKCFEKRKILLKGTTGKLTSPKGRFS